MRNIRSRTTGKRENEMTVRELKKELEKYDDDMEVMTKKTEVFGTVGNIFSVRQDSYWFFGKEIPCVLFTDEIDEERED